MSTYLADIGREINKINRGNGWQVLEPDQWTDPYKIPAVLALVHTEVSEAVEAFRNDDRANFEEELADVLIRVLDIVGGLGIDIDHAVLAKLAKNKTRGLRHGGKRI